MKFDKFKIYKLEDGRYMPIGYIKSENSLIAELREREGFYEDWEDRVDNGGYYLTQHPELVKKVVKDFKIDLKKGVGVAGVM